MSEQYINNEKAQKSLPAEIALLVLSNTPLITCIPGVFHQRKIINTWYDQVALDTFCEQQETFEKAFAALADSKNESDQALHNELKSTVDALTIDADTIYARLPHPKLFATYSNVAAIESHMSLENLTNSYKQLNEALQGYTQNDVSAVNDASEKLATSTHSTVVNKAKLIVNTLLDATKRKLATVRNYFTTTNKLDSNVTSKANVIESGLNQHGLFANVTTIKPATTVADANKQLDIEPVASPSMIPTAA